MRANVICMTRYASAHWFQGLKEMVETHKIVKMSMHILPGFFYWDQRYLWVEVCDFFNCQSYLRSECVLISLTFLYLRHSLRIKRVFLSLIQGLYVSLCVWLTSVAGRPGPFQEINRVAKRNYFFPQSLAFPDLYRMIYGFKWLILKLFV